MTFNKPVHFLGAGVTLSIVGLGLALLSTAFLTQGYAHKSWPTTDAQIVRSEVVVTKKALPGRRRAVFVDFYEAKIEYKYTVDGQDFVGDKLAEGFDPGTANAAVAKYPIGGNVTISYNPASPGSSVLDPTVNVMLCWAGVVFGLVTLTAGAVFWLKAIKIDDAQRSAAEVATSPRPAKARLQTVVDASITNSAQTTVEVPMHWLLRTIAVLIGLVFFFFGSLSLSVAVNMAPPQAANPAAPPAAAIIAQIIVIGIMAAIMFFGAFLVWIGMRRRTRRIAVSSAESIHTTPQSIEHATPPQMPDFGDFIAQCGPKEDGQTHYILCGAGMAVCGLIFGVMPHFFPLPKGADISDATFQTICGIGGGIFSLLGLGMMWKPLFGQNQMILLYERGLIERVGSISYAIALDEIEQLRIQEFYEHRFAPRTFNVRAKICGEKELYFSSALRGDSEKIIAYLSERIPQTELVPFQP